MTNRNNELNACECFHSEKKEEENHVNLHMLRKRIFRISKIYLTEKKKRVFFSHLQTPFGNVFSCSSKLFIVEIEIEINRIKENLMDL
mgnify:CR=1 FL=1